MKSLRRVFGSVKLPVPVSVQMSVKGETGKSSKYRTYLSVTPDGATLRFEMSLRIPSGVVFQ